MSMTEGRENATEQQKIGPQSSGCERRLRIGIYGGTFDPPHIGHLVTADQARQDANLDHLAFLPAGDPPHKGSDVTDVKHRLAMLRAAVPDSEAFSISTVEIDRIGESYSYNTMRAFSEKYPNADFFFLMGEDSFLDIEQWYRWEELLDLVTTLVMLRPEGTKQYRKKHVRTDTEAWHKELVERGFRVELLGDYALDISSTRLREDLKKGRSVRYLVPDAVLAYIEREGVYEREETEHER